MKRIDEDTRDFICLCVVLVVVTVITFIAGRHMGIEEFMLW